MRLFSLAALALLAAPAASQGPVEPAFSPELVRGHVEFLASDALEGRDAGTRGYDLAAAYVASQFRALGLQPGGDRDSWYQRVTLSKAELMGTPTLTIGDRRFAHGGDVIIGPSQREPEQALEAQVVFAGFGLDAPEQGSDDYRGLDVRDKYVAVLSGFPKGMPSDIGAHLNSEKAAMAEKRGALGVITVPTREQLTRRPWAQQLGFAHGPNLTWVGRDGRPYVRTPGLRAGASLNTPAAEALFAGARTSWRRVLDEADRPGGKPRGFALTPRVKIERSSRVTTVESVNVVGMIPGSTRALADEPVFLTAHLDHVGINETLTGDQLHNGAMDNAAGISTMIEAARAFIASGQKTRRPLYFIALTAEEDGLLGAQYLAKHPLGRARPAAVVNLDMPILLYDFTDVIAFGAEHSTLGPIVARATARAGVRMSPDPLPSEGLFTRSDHYRFVQEGVPSVFLMTGFAGKGAESFQNFLKTHYHKPSDETDLPFDWNAGAKFARINYLIAREIADAPERPRWYADSFFGRVFASGQPKAAR